MALTVAELAVVEHVVGSAADARTAAQALRNVMPQVRVTVQDAIDFRGEAPAMRTRAVDVHLMASDGHCWSLTARPDAASALVLADREG
jgi:hypothetical protein